MDPQEPHSCPRRSPFSTENLSEYDLPPDSVMATEEHPDLLVMKAVRQSGQDRALVLYNPQEHSFSVRSSKSVDVCPLCQRAFESKVGGQGNFANKNYFVLLARANALAKAQGSSALPDCHLGDAGSDLPAASAASPCSSSSSSAFGTSPASPTPSRVAKPRSPLSGHRARTPPIVTDFMPNADPLAEENTMSEYYKRFFIQGKKLGSGGYGGVWMCRHVLQGFDLGTYAVKKVPIGTDRNWLLRVLQEVKALERLHRHPNIIEYHHSWIEYDQPADFGPKVPCLFILMDYADHGTLEEYCQRMLISGEEEIWWHTINLCYALQHLHSNCILHRDVKPLNVLLASSNLQFPNVLLSDLGEAMQVMQRRNQRSGCTGTLEYCAPELLLEDEAGHLLVNHDFSSDMWGLGLIMYYMCFRRLPYNEDGDVVQQIRNAGVKLLEIPKTPKYSKELLNLMRMLLSPKPTDRPLPAHILRNSYVRHKWQALTDDLTTQSLEKDPSLDRGARVPPNGGLEDFKLNSMQLDSGLVNGSTPVLSPSPHKLPGSATPLLPMITGPDPRPLSLYGAVP